jgi:hypothetical protein
LTANVYIRAKALQMGNGLNLTGTIVIQGVNPYVLIHARQAASLMPGWRKPMPISLRINGEDGTLWRTNMMPSGTGDFYLYLHGEMRRESQTRVGDVVRLSIEFDGTYRNGPLHPMPEELEREFRADPIAEASWVKLSPSRQKEILRYFAGLKSDSARHRNLHRMISVLKGNKGHWMGRDWDDGK